jgi:hypothetical protein
MSKQAVPVTSVQKPSVTDWYSARTESQSGGRSLLERFPLFEQDETMNQRSRSGSRGAQGLLICSPQCILTRGRSAVAPG